LDQAEHTATIEQPWTRWFLYGDSGAGKTIAASTFPSPLFLVPANEKSDLSLLDLDEDFTVFRLGQDAQGTRVPVRQQMQQVLSDLEDRAKRMQDAFARADAFRARGTEDDLTKAAEFEAQANAALPWQTIVVESLTHYCDLVIEDLTNHATKQMNQGLWGSLSSHIRTIHDRLSSLPVHVVYTSLAKVVESDGGVARGGPAISGNMSSRLPAACDAFGYCESRPAGKDGMRYLVHFQRHLSFAARTRFRRMPKIVEDFNFRAIEHTLGRAPNPNPNENEKD
jgi:hypothetical protein